MLFCGFWDLSGKKKDTSKWSYIPTKVALAFLYAELKAISQEHKKSLKTDQV